MTAIPNGDSVHLSSRRILALEGLVASLGPAHLGDCVAILLAGLHAGAPAEDEMGAAAATSAGGSPDPQRHDQEPVGQPSMTKSASARDPRSRARRGIAA